MLNKGTGVFAAMMTLVAVCAFADDGLASGGTAVAEEAEHGRPEAETGSESVESAEQASEASESGENGSEGQETQNRPDGDEG